MSNEAKTVTISLKDFRLMQRGLISAQGVLRDLDRTLDALYHLSCNDLEWSQELEDFLEHIKAKHDVHLLSQKRSLMNTIDAYYEHERKEVNLPSVAKLLDKASEVRAPADIAAQKATPETEL